jgi:hypothetical protein
VGVECGFWRCDGDENRSYADGSVARPNADEVVVGKGGQSTCTCITECFPIARLEQIWAGPRCQDVVQSSHKCWPIGRAVSYREKNAKL